MSVCQYFLQFLKGHLLHVFPANNVLKRCAWTEDAGVLDLAPPALLVIYQTLCMLLQIFFPLYVQMPDPLYVFEVYAGGHEQFLQDLLIQPLHETSGQLINNH